MLHEAEELLARGAEGFLAFCEVESDVAMFWLSEEARSGHSGNAYLADKPFCGCMIGGISSFCRFLRAEAFGIGT